MTIDYTKILAKKYPNAEWTLNGDDYSGLIWLSDTPKPTKKTLDELWLEVKQIIESEQAEKQAAREAILAKLGLTEAEIATLIG
jgi:hypothetical protein